MSARQLEWHTELPPAAFLARLQSASAKDGPIAFPLVAELKTKRNVMAKIDREQFRLRMRQLRIRRKPAFGWFSFYTNSWAPVFYGRVAAANAGSIVNGHLETHVSVRWFFRIWMAAVLVAALYSVPAGFVAILDGDGAGIAGVIPPIMLLGGWLIQRLGHRLANDDREQLTDFIDDLIAATEASTSD